MLPTLDDKMFLLIKLTLCKYVLYIQHIELRAFEKGYLTNIYVDEGRLVKKGQKMFQIMPVLVKEEYEKAKAEYEASKIEFENTEMLLKEKVVSQTEYALAKARLQKNKAAMDLAKQHLDLTTIYAPFTGIMDKFQVRLFCRGRSSAYNSLRNIPTLDIFQHYGKESLR